MKPQLVKKPEASSDTVARTPARDAIADEFAPLDLEVKTLSARLRVLQAEGGTYNRLKDEIRGWYATKAADGKFLYESDKYVLEVSAAENEGVPDKKGLFTHLGASHFLDACTITQKATKEKLAIIRKPGLFEKLWSWARTGKRSVTALPKAAKEAA